MKNLSNEELESLSAEIRRFLIETLSESGGHIGPNLGVVELTIALHKVFDSPKDKFILDVGHQSYVHKMLTGRGTDLLHCASIKGYAVFQSGMKANMMSGKRDIARLLFPGRWGWQARDLKATNEYIIPIIGDGALTGGMALEALKPYRP